MAKFLKWAKIYLAIGLVIGLVSWATDETSGIKELGAVLVIAIVWPLWVLIQWLAG